MKLRMKLFAVIVIGLLALWGLGVAADGDQGEYDKPDFGPLPIQAVPGGDADVLMRLRRAVSNWNETVAMQPGYTGWDAPDGDPCSGRSLVWTGISCSFGRVDRIDLPNLGLDGYLPPELLQIDTLKQLNLSNNLFHGPLPPQWTSQSLTTLDLSNNVLSGPLPKNYGAEGVFPQLQYIFIQGNLLSGALPTPHWTQGFAPGAVIILRPGNDGLCGPVPLVDPSMLETSPYGAPPSAETMDFLNSVVDRSQYANALGGEMSKVYIFYEGIMAPDSAVVITNTLGSCAEPCGRAFTVTTNLLDATWEYNVSLADIMANNPGLTPADAVPGTQLALPCYPFGVGGPTWFGSDSAVGMFAGGHQTGIDGVVGGEIAGVVVGPNGLPTNNGIFYEGSRNGDSKAIGGGGLGNASSLYVLPIYWFVKMDATFTVSAVSITAGNAMSGISLFVGTNASDYQSNTLVQRDLQFAAGETKVVPVDHLMGKLVMVNADGDGTEGLSLANTKVWPAEGNAALNKPISTAGPLPLKANYSTDGSLSTCVSFDSDDDDSVWMGVDLGYDAAVAVVALTFGKDALAAADNVLVYVSSDDTLSSLTNATVCDPPYPETVIGKSHHVVVACGRKGRYVGVQVLAASTVNVCELEVFLESAPETPVKRTVAAKNVVGIAVGAALGGAALALLIVAAVVYYRRKNRRQQKAALTNSMIKGSMHNNGFGSSLPSTPSGLGGLSDPDALGMEAGKAGTTRHDSITSGAGAPPGGFFRKWIGLGSNGSSEHSGRSSPVNKNQLGGVGGGLDGMQPSTDLSKFDCDNCNIVDFKEIELVRTIGEGSFGLVWMARYLQTTVAVKILTHDLKRDVGTVGADSALTQQPSSQVMSALQREASIMAGLRHPNCIQYLGATLNPPALIMEYCSKRSVDTILAAAVNDPKTAKQLDWVHLMSMACDAAKGMLYLHTRSPPIVHRDLKSPNLLVDGLWHVKVSDFNLSRALENNAVVSSLQITNPRWLAPEVLKGGQAGKAADVYSFGVVLWELLTWKLPWGHDTNPFSIINSVGGGARLPIPAENELPAGPLRCFDAYVALMQHCWHPDPDARPTMDEVAQRLRGLLTEMVVNSRTESMAAAAAEAAEKAGKADDASSSGGESR